MYCVECDRQIKDCQCPDIEDRLRKIIASNTAFSGQAKLDLLERLASKPMTETDVENWTEEMTEVFDYALRQAWAKDAKWN
jgi:hypothetical protein